MAGSDAKIPPKLLGKIHPKNKEWFNLYDENNALTASYKKNIKEFLKFTEHNNRRFNEFTLNDVEKYRDMLIETAEFTSNSAGDVISAVSGFKNWLIDNTKDFRPEFLYGILTLKPEREDSKNPRETLGTEQIFWIKKYNQEQGTIYDTYIFELIFQLGINQNQLVLCLPKYKNLEKESFVYKDESEIPYNSKIAQLLGETDDINEDKLRHEMTNVSRGYFKRMTAYFNEEYGFEKKINATNVRKSHEVYFVPCPNCREKTEYIAKNWILLRAEFNDEYRLVCAKCKGK